MGKPAYNGGGCVREVVHKLCADSGYSGEEAGDSFGVGGYVVPAGVDCVDGCAAVVPLGTHIFYTCF